MLLEHAQELVLLEQATEELELLEQAQRLALVLLELIRVLEM